MWSKDQSCDILMKNVAGFCLYPKSLPEAKVKSLGLIVFVKEISKQSGIDSVRWLLRVHSYEDS